MIIIVTTWPFVWSRTHYIFCSLEWWNKWRTWLGDMIWFPTRRGYTLHSSKFVNFFKTNVPCVAGLSIKRGVVGTFTFFKHVRFFFPSSKVTLKIKWLSTIASTTKKKPEETNYCRNRGHTCRNVQNKKKIQKLPPSMYCCWRTPSCWH